MGGKVNDALPWAETVLSEDGGKTLRIPAVDEEGREVAGILVRDTDVPTLRSMLEGLESPPSSPEREALRRVRAVLDEHEGPEWSVTLLGHRIAKIIDGLDQRSAD